MIMLASAGWLLAVVGVVAVAGGRFDPKDGRHDIIMGERDGSDKLLFHDNPVIEYKLFPYPKVQSSDVCFPPLGAREQQFIITAFQVSDRVGHGNGGYAFVTDGGVGFNRLCFHLKTQRGRGYNFDIDVWGRTLDNKSH